MKGEIVTKNNCKVGDKIMYTEEYLRRNIFYRELMKDYNIIYLKIKSKSDSDIIVNLVTYKGMVHNIFHHRIMEKTNKFYFYE